MINNKKLRLRCLLITSGRKPMPSTVVFEAKIVASPVWHSSPQDSFSLKKTATPIMEMQMKASEMMSRIFRPTLSMINIVRPVPAT